MPKDKPKQRSTELVPWVPDCSVITPYIIPEDSMFLSAEVACAASIANKLIKNIILECEK